MTSLAEAVFDKSMSRVPAKHRKLSFAEAKAAVEKKMELMERGVPFQKIIDKPRGYATFDEAVAAIRKAEACSGTQAMQKTREQHPSLYQSYQQAGAVSSRPVFDKKAPAKAVQDFDLAVSAIQQRDRVMRTVAMSRARAERPELYRAYQQA